MARPPESCCGDWYGEGWEKYRRVVDKLANLVHSQTESTITIQSQSAIVLDLTKAERIAYYEREIERIGDR